MLWCVPGQLLTNTNAFVLIIHRTPETIIIIFVFMFPFISLHNGRTKLSAICSLGFDFNGWLIEVRFIEAIWFDLHLCPTYSQFLDWHFARLGPWSSNYRILIHRSGKIQGWTDSDNNLDRLCNLFLCWQHHFHLLFSPLLKFN